MIRHRRLNSASLKGKQQQQENEEDHSTNEHGRPSDEKAPPPNSLLLMDVEASLSSSIDDTEPPTPRASSLENVSNDNVQSQPEDCCCSATIVLQPDGGESLYLNDGASQSQQQQPNKEPSTCSVITLNQQQHSVSFISSPTSLPPPDLPSYQQHNTNDNNTSSHKSSETNTPRTHNERPFDDFTEDTVSLVSWKTALSDAFSEMINAKMKNIKSPDSISISSTNLDSIVSSIIDDNDFGTPVGKISNDEIIFKFPDERATTPTETSDLKEKVYKLENLIGKYRAENSMLRNELRQIQDIDSSGHTIGTSNFTSQTTKELLTVLQKQKEDLKNENEKLKGEIGELRAEMTEIQDQYREEEIEEFREIQRELEQNAKNCRILQFKLRKSERQKEQLLTEKNLLMNKLKKEGNIKNVSSDCRSDDPDCDNSEESDSDRLSSSKIKELESELRIAKEVSVRLHSELESSEDKRYKLEDDVFYYKEKVRELQAQNKWREAKYKPEPRTHPDWEAHNQKIMINGNDDYREIRDVLEREADLRDHLKFTEEDLKRTRWRLQEMELENEELIEKYSKVCCEMSASKNLTRSLILPSENTETRKRPPLVRSVSEGEKDNNKSSTIVSVKFEQKENKNKTEQKITEQKKLNGSPMESNGKVILEVELRKEKQEKKELTKMLDYYRQFIATSGEQRLIELSTKMESLQNQLKLYRERLDILHLREKQALNADSNYLDKLKDHCFKIEQELSSLKAEKNFNTRKPVKESGDDEKPMATSEEIEQCCIMLASVEGQTDRIFKQLQKFENNNNLSKAERRRSLNKEGLHYANMVLDLTNVLTELRVLHQALSTRKILQHQDSSGLSESCSSLSTVIAAAVNKNEDKHPNGTNQISGCKDCTKNEQLIKELTNEVQFYKKKNKEITNQILRTENHWHVEIENREKSNNLKFNALEFELKKANQQLAEQVEIEKANTILLSEKSQLVIDLRFHVAELMTDLEKKQKQIKSLEQHQKILKEWEIKHYKLSNLFKEEKEKYEKEKDRLKAEIFEMKKKADEAVSDNKRLQIMHENANQAWLERVSKLETEIEVLKKSTPDRNIENKMNFTSAHEESDEEVTAVHTIQLKKEHCYINGREKETIKGLKGNRTSELKDRMNILEKQNTDLKREVEKFKCMNVQTNSEFENSRKKWNREKETLVHKQKQELKIKNIELANLREKFDSRMSAMEETNKSLNIQLLQTRRERDSHLATIEQFKQQIVTNIRETDTPVDPSSNIKNVKSAIVKPNSGVREKFTHNQKSVSENESLTEHPQESEGAHNELMEQLKVLEIDQRNLVEANEISRIQLKQEQERMQQIIRNIGLQQTARRYKLTALVAQLSSIPSQLTNQEKVQENEMLIENAVSQLNSLKKEDFQGFIEGLENSKPVTLVGYDSFESLRIKHPQKSSSMNLITNHNYYANKGFEFNKVVNSSSLGRDKNNSISSSKHDDKLAKSTTSYSNPSTTRVNKFYDTIDNDVQDLLHYVKNLPSGSSHYQQKESDEDYYSRCRLSSTGTNILYKIHRKELEKGNNLSTVRSITQAFESLNQSKPEQKTRTKKIIAAKLFGLKKAHSVDTNTEKNNKPNNKVILHQKGSTESMSGHQFDQQSSLSNESSSNFHRRSSTEKLTATYSTLPRRNPLRNIGTKIVDRVRRSLSRSRNTSESCESNLKQNKEKIICSSSMDINTEDLKSIISPKDEASKMIPKELPPTPMSAHSSIKSKG